MRENLIHWGLTVAKFVATATADLLEAAINWLLPDEF